MNRTVTLLAAVVAAVPLVVAAQTANTPGGSAATGSPLDQTKGTPAQTAPSRTQTNPDMTNPAGALPSKSGTANDTASPGASTGETRATTTKAHKGMAHTNGKTAPGDAPTYPAPAPDGTPTK